MSGGVTAEAITYRPTGYYFRRALRSTNDPERLREIGMTAVLEIEQLRQWARGLGHSPPKEYVMRSEIEENGWTESPEIETREIKFRRPAP